MKTHKTIFASILRSINHEPDTDLSNFTAAQIDWHTVRLQQMGYVEITGAERDGIVTTEYHITSDGLKALFLLQQNVNPF